MLVETSLEFFEIFVEHILSAELIPSSEVVDLHIGQDAMLLEDPVDLLFFAPHEVPVIIPGLLPLSANQTVVDAIFEGGFELYGGSSSFKNYGLTG